LKARLNDRSGRAKLERFPAEGDPPVIPKNPEVPFFGAVRGCGNMRFEDVSFVSKSRDISGSHEAVCRPYLDREQSPTKFYLPFARLLR
jgi:hypothetical protein